MISNLLSEIMFGVITWIVNLAPVMTSQDYNNVSSITNAINSFLDIIYWSSFFFPINLAFIIISLIITIEFILFTIKAIRWIGSIVSGGIIK